jgi:hypothetical protein
MTKAPCKFHLLQGACSFPVVCTPPRCSCPVVYRVTGRGACVPDAMQHGRSVLQPLDLLSRAVGRGHDALQIRDRTELRRPVEARHASPLRSTNSKLAKVPDQRSTTTRRYRPSGLQERVRRVVLHRIRDTHTILADQWRHECDANILIIARDLSSARLPSAQGALRLHHHPSPRRQGGCLLS